MSDRKFTYERARSGYDEEFERELVNAITNAVMEASRVSDANLIAIRTGELCAALITLLATTLALSPGVTRSPTSIRTAVDEVAKRLRARIARGKDAANEFRNRCFDGGDEGGHA